jgi:hypothetical protein
MKQNPFFRAALGIASSMASLTLALALLYTSTNSAQAQRGAPAPGAPTTAKAAAPFDLTGYWVSMITDEWRFRVKPEKGDIVYLPLNNDARKMANSWDPDKDSAEGNACKAYGAVGVMQRPGRLHITWQDDNTLKIETDAGTQTRIIHFGSAAAAKVAPSWQGYSTAQWFLNTRPLLSADAKAYAPGQGAGRVGLGGTLNVTTSDLLPGYLRKNGVPYSGNAMLSESFNVLQGQLGETYFVVTQILTDPMYLNQPFIRTYQFKKQTNDAGWEPTACLPR